MEHPDVWARVDGYGPEPGDRSRGTRGLVGRDGELAELRSALALHRLVTVTGAAGIGKSRLARTLAASPVGDAGQAVVRVRWHDGVPVGPRALTARLLRALTAAAGAPPGGVPSLRRTPAAAREGVDIAEAARAVPAETLLVVLDDIDPVHTECAGLVQRLLMAVPGLRVLVTARRVLGLGDEHVIRVAPLEVESPPGGTEPSPAVALFLSRTPSRAHGGLPVRASELPTVRRVCRLLEGVPLAIELAAGQLGDRTLRELAARLEADQCWLTGPGPALRRHRSLHASIGAVHTLCDPVVRTVWHRASVFEGSFTEAAAVLLCSGAGVEPDRVPSCLALLSATGVLRALGEPGGVRRPRYRMARAARDFGTERLRSAGELPAALARHAVHYRGVAAVAETLWHMGLQHQALQTVLDEYDDLMALAPRALAGGDGRPPDAEHIEEAMEVVLRLWFWWAVHEQGREGSALLLGLLPHLPPGSPLAPRGQWLAAWLTAAHDPRTARRLLDLAWPAAVMAGDDALIGRISHVHGTLAWHRRDPEEAVRYYRQAADTVPESAPGGPPPAVSLAALAVVQAHTDPRTAGRTAHHALAQPRNRDDAWATALAHYARAFADHRAGRTGRARRRAHRALTHLATGPDTAPQARAALRRLLDHLETPADGAPVRHDKPFVPVPRAGTRSGARPSATEATWPQG